MSWDSGNTAERATQALERIAQALEDALADQRADREAARQEAAAMAERMGRSGGMVNRTAAPRVPGNCNEPSEYMGRVIRCQFSPHNDDDHESRIPGGVQRWSTLVSP